MSNFGEHKHPKKKHSSRFHPDNGTSTERQEDHFRHSRPPRSDARAGFSGRKPHTARPAREDKNFRSSRFSSRGEAYQDTGSIDRHVRRARFERRMDSSHFLSERIRADEDITGSELPRAVRAQLKTLQKDNAEKVAKHLIMAERYFDQNPHVAYAHAVAATQTAGRLAPVRETAGLTAYNAGKFKEALAELRTHRRISGSHEYLPLMADSQRGLGKPEKAIEMAQGPEVQELSTPARVELAIVLSGAYADLENYEKAKSALEIPQLDQDKGFSYSPRLFRAYADILEKVEETEQASQWRVHALKAERALGIFPEENNIVDLLGEEHEEEN